MLQLDLERPNSLRHRASVVLNVKQNRSGAGGGWPTRTIIRQALMQGELIGQGTSAWGALGPDNRTQISILT